MEFKDSKGEVVGKIIDGDLEVYNANELCILLFVELKKQSDLIEKQKLVLTEKTATVQSFNKLISKLDV